MSIDQTKAANLKQQIKRYESQIDTILMAIKSIKEEEEKENSTYKKRLNSLKLIDNKEALSNQYNDFAMYNANHKKAVIQFEERILNLKKNMAKIEENKEKVQHQLHLIYSNNKESEEKDNG